MIEARWATLTATPCMHRSYNASSLLSHCADPTPDGFVELAHLTASLTSASPSARPARMNEMAREATRRHFRASFPVPVVLPGTPTSALALVVSCAAQVAQARAHEYRLLRDKRLAMTSDVAAARDATTTSSGGDGGGGGGGGGGAHGAASSNSWMLYVSSDSAGMRSVRSAARSTFEVGLARYDLDTI